MSEGHCDVSFYDYSGDADPCDFFNITKPRARVEHFCSQCRQVISPGERYVRVGWKFEGRVGTDKSCEPCWEAMQEFEYFIYGGDFWSHMREEWDQGANVQGCINRLTTVAAKTRMLQQWMKWKGL